MKRNVRLREEAGRDLHAAAVWYHERCRGLGHEFLDDVLSTFESIADRPLTYALIYRHMRRALVRRFPFGVYFRLEHPEIPVVAVIHGSRHPRHWKNRS